MKDLFFRSIGFCIGLILVFLFIKVKEHYEDKKIIKQLLENMDRLDLITKHIKPNSFPTDVFIVQKTKP